LYYKELGCVPLSLKVKKPETKGIVYLFSRGGTCHVGTIKAGAWLERFISLDNKPPGGPDNNGRPPYPAETIELYREKYPLYKRGLVLRPENGGG
jgi:hypothetical protein